MNTRFTDAWRRQSESDFYGENERFTVSGPTDPAHGDKSDAPPPLMMDAPTSQDGGEIYTDATWENWDALEDPIRIDETPVGGQGTPAETGHGFGGDFTPGQDISVLAGHRGIDRGAHIRATRTTPTYKFWDDKFFGFFTTGFNTPLSRMPVSNPVYVRGLSAHPVNNGQPSRPTAWTVNDDDEKISNSARRGDYEGSNVERGAFSPPRAIPYDLPGAKGTHPIKVVESDIITIIGDAPPPHQSDTYASPFSSLQKFMPKARRVRGTRRDPGPWDEDLQSQDVGVSQPTGADGLVVQ
jgi:hypothetical protein